MTTLIVKKCSKCQKEKEAHFFSKDKNRKYGLQAYCKLCISKIPKNINLEKERNARKKRYKSNKEKTICSVNKWKAKNLEKVKEDQKNWYEKNAEKHKLYAAILLMKHKLGEEVPEEIVKLKQLQLKLYWLIKEKSSQQSKSV